MPYPFNYFASIFNFRSSFANRKKLSWFQMIFTSFFLISITLLPVALQNAQLKTYPLTTFVSDVFDPLSTDVMKDIQEHVVIKDQELTYTGTNPVHKTSKGQVILGQEARDFLWLLIDSQLFDSHRRGIFLPLLDTKISTLFTTNFQGMFQLYSELLGTPYFTECLHQFTIPSSIYYDDHDPKCLICTLSCYGIL